MALESGAPRHQGVREAKKGEMTALDDTTDDGTRTKVKWGGKSMKERGKNNNNYNNKNNKNTMSQNKWGLSVTWTL